MKKWIVLLLLLAFTGVIAGCSSPGNEYEGKWIASTKSIVDSTQIVNRLEIKKNDKNYIIDSSTEGYLSVGKGKVEWKVIDKKTFSATIKDGKLMTDPMTAFTFVKNDGTILGPRGEVFKKESSEELARLKKEAAEIYKKKYPERTIEE